MHPGVVGGCGPGQGSGVETGGYTDVHEVCKALIKAARKKVSGLPRGSGQKGRYRNGVTGHEDKVKELLTGCPKGGRS